MDVINTYITLRTDGLTCNFTIDFVPTLGNTLIVGFYRPFDTTNSVVDNGGGSQSYVRDLNTGVWTAGDMAIWRRSVIDTIPTVVSITSDDTFGSPMYGFVAEITGMLSASPVDTTLAFSGTASDVNHAESMTLAELGELMIGWITADANRNFTTTGGAGNTNHDEIDTSQQQALAWKLPAGSGSQSINYSLDTAAAGGAALVAYKALAVGASNQIAWVRA